MEYADERGVTQTILIISNEVCARRACSEVSNGEPYQSFSIA